MIYNKMYKKLKSFNNNTLEVISLTNINCSSNCLYQKDGKCTLEKVDSKPIISTSDCIYFTKVK